MSDIKIDEELEEEFDEHTGCPSWPNCDLMPLGCTVEMGLEDVEWYGYR